MPLLPLPTGPVPLDHGDLPVNDEADIAAVEPDFVRRSTLAPVRDLIRKGLLGIMLNYQHLASRAAQLSDRRKSEDIYLTGLAGDLGTFRQESEDDESVRARIDAGDQVVSPNAILAAVNAQLEGLTTIEAAYCESVLDAWFVGDGTETGWSSHVFARGTAMGPTYPDRLYTDEAAHNGGAYVPNRSTQATRVFDTYGRMFLVRIPDLGGLDIFGTFAFAGVADPIAAYVYGPPHLEAEGEGWFVGADAFLFNSTGEVLLPIPEHMYVGDGTETVEMSFIAAFSLSESQAYQKIINAVERIKGHGIRWSLWVDPNLS